MYERKIRRGEIYWIHRDDVQVVGSEQGGTRPAIVVSNDAANQYSSTCEIVYLTATPKKELPTHVAIKSAARMSVALCEQITTISKRRIGDYIGTISPIEMKNVNDSMLISLGLLDTMNV